MLLCWFWSYFLLLWVKNILTFQNYEINITQKSYDYNILLNGVVLGHE